MNTYKLIQGDCLQVLPTLGNESVDLIVTDPPFKVETLDFPFLLSQCGRILKSGGAIYCYWSSKGLTWYEPLFRKEFNLKNILSIKTKNFITHPWDKEAFDFKWTPVFFGIKGKLGYHLGKRCLERGYNSGDAWDCVMPQSNWKKEKKFHQWQKPESSIKRMVAISSEKNDVVLDPFLGSGTTMKVAQDLGRSCIGIEINPDYCEIVKNRCFTRTFLDRKVEYEFSEFNKKGDNND